MRYSDVLGYRVAVVSLPQAVDWALGATRRPGNDLLVTLNPEIIIQAQTSPSLEAALQAAALTVADGVGVVWAARQLGRPLPERIAGVELVSRLLEAGGADLKVYFLGARPGIAAKAAEAAHARFGTEIGGTHHGYFKGPNETAEVVRKVSRSGANLLLAGLGEGQELFLYEHREALGTNLMIGVGGTLDVLSGEVKRTPTWTRRLGLEWAYRVGLDPKRWHRFPRLLQFVTLVLKAKSRRA